MPQPAIRVEGLGKKYQITHETHARYKTLREMMVHAAAAPVRWVKGVRRQSQEEFWALSDVSFEVQPGETTAIVGRNGAGKSTLLKILSRVTRPTEGRVELNGRVGSLLEVGTGFHPELTGRENVYLNGSILGMTRREIERKFDEIVAFAEVEKFLDTPVKRYSSGMYVRLAFAVAAHLEPEILIVDEVLAVGDAGFQKKCIDRMKECATQGSTVLLVSHQMSTVRDLSDSAVWLAEGSVNLKGNATHVIDRYLSHVGTKTPHGRWVDLTTAPRTGTGQVKFIAVRCHGETVESAPIPDGTFNLTVRLRSAAGLSADLRVEFQILDRYQTRALQVNTYDGGRPLKLPEDESEITFTIDSLHLTPGSYSINLLVGDAADLLDAVGDAVRIDVVPSRPSDGEPLTGSSLVTRSFDYTQRPVASETPSRSLESGLV